VSASNPYRPATEGRSFKRLLFPGALALLFLALLVAWVGPVSSETITVSELTRRIREIALRGTGEAGVEQGGEIGPWWIAADSGDPVTGEFANFRLSSGSLHLAAKTAMLHVDPDANTISFDMSNVVFASIPVRRVDDVDEEHFLHRVDQYTLGPAPVGFEIAADGRSNPSGSSPSSSVVEALPVSDEEPDAQ
jgi:hypothetical protein